MRTENPIAVNHGDKLRDWRKNQGIHHSDLASRLDTSIATLYRIEQGYAPPIKHSPSLLFLIPWR